MPRTTWFLLIALLAGLLLSRESRRPGPIGGIDRAFFDWLSANVRPAATSSTSQVTLVEIDDSVFETPGRWPLSPLDYALFLQAVQKFDPAVIAIEPILNWPIPQPGNEEILINQALTAPKLLLGAQLGSAQGQPDAAPLRPIEPAPTNLAAVPQFPEVVAAPNGRLFPFAQCGVTNLPAPGAPLREIPLLLRRRMEVLPSFTLQALGLWLQVAASEITAQPGDLAQLGPSRRVPLDRAGAALLDAGAFRQLNRVGLDDLLLLTADQPTAVRMKGGLVLLGQTNHAARVYALPSGTRLSAAEALAWAAQSLRNRPELRRAPVGWDIGITLAAAALGMVLLRQSRRRTFAIAAGCLALYTIGALGVFDAWSLWLPFALPLGLILCLGACRFLPRGVS